MGKFLAAVGKVYSSGGAWRFARKSPRANTREFTIGIAFLALVATAGFPQQPLPNKSPEADMVRADNLLRQGKAQEALTLLNELAKNDPKPPGLEAKLGKVNFKLGKFQAAIPLLQAAVERDSNDWESLQLLALSYFSVGNCQEALPLLLRVGPHLPKGEIDDAYLRGVCYLKTAQWDSARAAFAEMFATPPDSPMAHLMLAKMMLRQRLEERAAPEIQKALELDSRLPMAHFLRGEIYLYKSDPRAAVEEFQKELKINPTVWLVYWRLGDAYARLEKYEEAEKVLKESIWLNDSATGPYLLLGQIQLKKGDPELAAGFLERATKLDPQNYFAHYSLAKAYEQLGRTDDANRHFAVSQTLRRQKENSEQLFFRDITQ